jgi:hypothetical protein
LGPHGDLPPLDGARSAGNRIARLSRAFLGRNIPLTDSVAGTALSQVNVNMVGVVGVRSRSEHGREARAGGGAPGMRQSRRQAIARDAEDAAIAQAQDADIERIAPCVFAQLVADDAVAPSAFIGRRGADLGKRAINAA